MATVNVYTTEKVDELTDPAVVNATVDGSSHLILTTQGGDTIDAGIVGGGGTGTISDASTTVKGIVQLATDVETTTGTDSAKAVTPFSLSSVTSSLTTSINAKQPSDPNLTAIANLTPANNDVIQRKAGVWTNRTPAQLAVDLGVTTAAAVAFYNVKADGTVKGDGVTDDTTALNTVLANSPVGSTVYFPQGTYIVSNMIKLPSLRHYLGGGSALGNGVLIKQKNGANIHSTTGSYGALFASNDWATNAATSGYSIVIENIAFYGNKENNPSSTACGIVLMNFWSRIQDCYIMDMPQHGIMLTDQGYDGSTQISNSASENRIMKCKIDGSGANAIHQDWHVEGTNLDGLIEDCYISGNYNGTGIYFDRSAGWAIRRNHIYGIGNHGIELGHSFATHVSDNYIEDFGQLNAASTWYWGIGFTQMDWWATQIVDNHIACPELSTHSSFYYGIRANAGSGEANGRCTITGNQIFGNSGTNGSGIVLEGQSGGAFVAVVRNNYITNLANPYVNGTPTVTIQVDGSPTIVGSPTVAAGAQASAASVVNPYGMDNGKGCVAFTTKSSGLAAGVLGTVTFSTPYPYVPRCISISPINGLASNAAIYATWTAGVLTFNANTALSANTSYQFAYKVDL